MKNGNAKILLVEDDTSLGYVIKDNMEQYGLDVRLCVDGEAALQSFKKFPFDLCVLDVMLPKLDGFTLAEKIRESDKHIPIIFLTAKSMKEDKIKGFQLGADDYIVKPFNIEELILRIRVFLKRSGKNEEEQSSYILGKYMFDYSNLELTHKKGNKQLTRKEGDLLKLLCDHKESTVKREQILKQVWGNDDYFAGRSMDVFISKLRKYFSEDPSVEIMNHHGIGFKLTIHQKA